MTRPCRGDILDFARRGGRAAPARVALTPMGAAPGGFVKYRVEPK